MRVSYFAQDEPPPKSLLIPDKLETPIGTLNFKDGAPDEKTVQVLYDNLDFLHAQNVFLNTYQGASTYAFGEGFYSVGAKDNECNYFSRSDGFKITIPYGERRWSLLYNYA